MREGEPKMNLDPIQTVVERFEQVSAIPRCSKNEGAIAAWLQRWAAERSFAARRDAVGNLCIRIPASGADPSAPTIALQGHMDMVCEKTPGSKHDFTSDPIRPIRDGDWLRADQTTLGADNGIALALALAIAEARTTRPPLELLFTVDEESGLLGASRIDPGLFEGSILLNLDSEEEGVFTIGCAGGEETRLHLDLASAPPGSDSAVLDIEVSGLRGGHSGIDIHKNHASANKLLTRLLQCFLQQTDLFLISLQGGTVHNAIARDASARIVCRRQARVGLREPAERLFEIFRREYPDETDLSVRLQEDQNKEPPSEALDAASTRRIVHLLGALPHGVARMTPDMPDLVETSSNLATVEVQNRTGRILSSQRSAVMSRLEEITSQVKSAGTLAGARTERVNHYPAWEPAVNSPLLARCRSVYASVFEQQPGVQTIHAGLECGLIGARKPGLDMISFGPTIENPHSPQERLHLPSLERTWRFLTALLESYAGSH
jgi:dipeptidase D